MKWFEISEELIPRLKELQEKDANYSIVKSENAVVMFYGLGDPLYLTFDGRVLIEDMLDDIPPREAKTLAEAATAIVAGAKAHNFPELLSILPSRPQNADDCKNCETSGYVKLFENADPFICGDCGGLGWIVKENFGNELTDF